MSGAPGTGRAAPVPRTRTRARGAAATPLSPAVPAGPTSRLRGQAPPPAPLSRWGGRGLGGKTQRAPVTGPKRRPRDGLGRPTADIAGSSSTPQTRGPDRAHPQRGGPGRASPSSALRSIRTRCRKPPPVQTLYRPRAPKDACRSPGDVGNFLSVHDTFQIKREKEQKRLELGASYTPLPSPSPRPGPRPPPNHHFALCDRESASVLFCLFDVFF